MDLDPSFAGEVQLLEKKKDKWETESVLWHLTDSKTKHLFIQHKWSYFSFVFPLGKYKVVLLVTLYLSADSLVCLG